MLFKDQVFTKTGTMSDVGDIFTADIQYHDHCCKSFMNKYHATIEEIMANLELEDLVSATNSSLKKNFWPLTLILVSQNIVLVTLGTS